MVSPELIVDPVVRGWLALVTAPESIVRVMVVGAFWVSWVSSGTLVTRYL